MMRTLRWPGCCPAWSDAARHAAAICAAAAGQSGEFVTIESVMECTAVASAAIGRPGFTSVMKASVVGKCTSRSSRPLLSTFMKRSDASTTRAASAFRLSVSVSKKATTSPACSCTFLAGGFGAFTPLGSGQFLAVWLQTRRQLEHSVRDDDDDDDEEEEGEDGGKAGMDETEEE